MGERLSRSLPELKREQSSLRQYFDETVAPYFSRPNANWAFIEKDRKYFSRRFPVIHYTLVGEPVEKALPDGGKVLDFDQQYSGVRIDGKVVQGTSHLTVELRFADGQWKIAGIHERVDTH